MVALAKTKTQRKEGTWGFTRERDEDSRSATSYSDVKRKGLLVSATDTKRMLTLLSHPSIFLGFECLAFESELSSVFVKVCCCEETL